MPPSKTVLFAAMAIYWAGTFDEPHGWLHGGYRIAMAVTMGVFTIISWLSDRRART